MRLSGQGVFTNDIYIDCTALSGIEGSYPKVKR